MPSERSLTTAVTQVLFRYARGIDRMDADLTLACFEPDALIHYGGKFRGTPQGFVDWLWPLHAGMVGHVHSISNVLVEEEPVVASEAYVTVMLRMNDGDEVFDYVSRGRYLDTWRVDVTGEPRIAERLYVNDFRTTAPVLARDTEGQLPLSDITHTPGSRTPGDPSYVRLAGGSVDDCLATRMS